MNYTAWVSNDSGATDNIAYKSKSKRSIYDYARENYGGGWTLHIIDQDGAEVQTTLLRAYR